MRDAYIVGIDMTPFDRRLEQSLAALGGKRHCSLSIEANRMVGQRIMREIGETGVPVVNVASACATGDLLSKGHPLGATGFASLYDVALQVRGEAGSRQVEGARLGLAHVAGGGPEGGAACVIHLLEGP